MHETEQEIADLQDLLDRSHGIRLYRFRPHWMVGYAFNRSELLRSRGLPAR